MAWKDLQVDLEGSKGGVVEKGGRGWWGLRELHEGFPI